MGLVPIIEAVFEDPDVFGAFCAVETHLFGAGVHFKRGDHELDGEMDDYISDLWKLTGRKMEEQRWKYGIVVASWAEDPVSLWRPIIYDLPTLQISIIELPNGERRWRVLRNAKALHPVTIFVYNEPNRDGKIRSICSSLSKLWCELEQMKNISIASQYQNARHLHIIDPMDADHGMNQAEKRKREEFARRRAQIMTQDVRSSAAARLMASSDDPMEIVYAPGKISPLDDDEEKEYPTRLQIPIFDKERLFGDRRWQDKVVTPADVTGANDMTLNVMRIVTPDEYSTSHFRPGMPPAQFDYMSTQFDDMVSRLTGVDRALRSSSAAKFAHNRTDAWKSFMLTLKEFREVLCSWMRHLWSVMYYEEELHLQHKHRKQRMKRAKERGDAALFEGIEATYISRISVEMPSSTTIDSLEYMLTRRVISLDEFVKRIAQVVGLSDASKRKPAKLPNDGSGDNPVMIGNARRDALFPFVYSQPKDDSFSGSVSNH